MTAATDAWRRHGVNGSADVVRRALVAGTIPDAAHSSAALAPHHPALKVGDEAVTHDQLDGRVAVAAGRLQERGVARGDRVLLCGPSAIDLIVAYLAVLRAGATAVFAGATASVAEVRHLLADSEASVAVLASEVATTGVDAAAGSVPVWELSDVAGPHGRGLALEEVIARSDDVAVLAYTSGTTGVPKGVPLTHANLLASIRGATAAWAWQPSDVLVHALPLTHQHGLSGVHAALVHGSTTVVRSRFDPTDLAHALVESKATVLFAVPTIYERLLEWGGLPGTDLSALRLVISGSAPMSPALFARVAEAFGQPPLERYGTTETGLDISNPYEGDRRPGAVGFPLPGVELAVVDGHGREIPRGTVGEIVLRGPQVFAGYWRRPEETRTAFFDGGWFRTGDLGQVDPDDGSLVITGRSKELIITGGLNVYPREVELALEEHTGVRRAAVLGVPSERWGEEVWALLVVDEGFDRADLDAHVRTRLAPHKRPKGVVVVDDLPLTSVGKLVRRALPLLLAREQPLGALARGSDA